MMRACNLLGLLAAGLLAVGGVAAPEEPALAACVAGIGEFGAVDPASLAGWQLLGSGATVRVVAGLDGRPALRLAADEGDASASRWLLRAVDAGPLRGQRVRVTASGRSSGEVASLWLRARDGEGRIIEGTRGTIQGGEWRAQELLFEVPVAAHTVELAVGLAGNTFVELGEVSLARVQAGCLGCAPARPLVRVDNLVAFTRLLGQVRYFHASDEAAAADWEVLAIAGVQAVEAAATPEALATALERVFLPVAPSLRVTLGPGTPGAVTDEPGEALLWMHRGAPEGGRGRVHERRRWASLAGYPGVVPGDPGPRPGRPLEVELGRGLVAHVPLAVRQVDGRTLPAATQAPLQLSRPAGFVVQAGDRSVRLAIVALAAAAFEHFSLRADRAALADGAALRAMFVDAAVAEDRFALRALLWRYFSELGETSAQAHIDSDVELGWRPQLGWSWIAGEVVVTSGDRHAADSCVQKGDVIEAIDGESVERGLARTAGLNRRASEEHTMISAISVWARGRAGDHQAFAVRHMDGSRATCQVRRAEAWASRIERPTMGVAELAGGVVYVDPHRASVAELAASEARIAGARGVILDLRRSVAPGKRALLVRWFGELGHRSMPIRVASGEPAFEAIPIDTNPGELTLRGPLVVLIGWSTQGEEEGIADALRSRHGAVLVGTATSGWAGASLGEVQLPAGFKVGWIDSGFRFVSGASVTAVIEPDIVARPTRESVAAGRDVVLERGLEAITQPTLWAARGP